MILDQNYKYIKANEPPKREDRLGAGCTFGGKCSEVKGKCSCMKLADRAFTQTQGCQLYLSSSIINTMLNIAIIIHGPVGCGGANIFSAGTTRTVQRLRDPGASGLLWLSTNLDSADVITGGEKKLRDAILYADKEFQPQAIMVVSTCVPSLIGDDIDTLLSSLQPQSTAKLVPVHCAGFKTTINATAYDAVYHGILRTMVNKRFEDYDEPTLLDEIEQFRQKLQRSRTVNVFNMSSISRDDEVELTRLLNALDLNVRIFPCYARPNDFETIDEAALNVSVCPTHDDYFSGHLKEMFGTPYLYRTLPVGITNTRKWVLDIAEFFGLTERAEYLLAQEEKELREGLEPLKNKLEGKTAYLTGGSIRTLATAQFLKEELGMKIIGIKGYHYDFFADELIEELKGDEELNYSVATAQEFEQSNLLRKLKPDIYIGHVELNGWAARHGIPTFPLFLLSSAFLGYRGAYELARKLVRVSTNAAFNKNLAKYTKLPYKEQWFHENPFKYIREK